MTEVRQTSVFEKWLAGLRDRVARTRIAARIDRLAFGNMADVAPVGGGVSELRVHHGPGYRVYFVRREETVIVLLCGGDKSSQAADISRAHEIAADLKAGRREEASDD